MSQMLPMAAKVSVIIPARNEASGIGLCLAALAAQKTEDVEIIVVDNGSTDDTASRASTFPVTIVSEPRPGRAVARNAGIRAAHGDILAFTDADCVPCPSWLRELLAGADDPELGCFVGEIEPLDPANTVAHHVHERRLICQLRLLSQSPPVAATGSIAYRRSVFDTIGLFDERFECGEDGDLFWRMVRSHRFRYRYNARAVVAHPHPSRVSDFARRSFHEGRGLTRFRCKHREDLPASFSSKAFVISGLLRAIAGCALYPIRAAQALLVRRLPLRHALAGPLLDKVCSISRLAGALSGYDRDARLVPDGDTTAHDGLGRFRDRLILDLATARLLNTPHNGLRDRVGSELGVLGRSLAELFPGSSILLTGSLFVGEGRVTENPDGPCLSSDYDLFVVTPRLTDAIPLFARPKIDRLMAGLPRRCARAEIGLVWKPLLERHSTTVGGAVIAGPTLADLLRELPAPRGFSALLTAYRCLTAAPLHPEGYAELCASALIRAARAVLFAEKDGLPRREWIALFSVEIVGAKIADWAPIIGQDAVDTVRDAAAFLLGNNATGPDPARHEQYVRIVNGFAARVPRPRTGLFAAKQFLRMLRTRQFGTLFQPTSQGLFEGLRTLAASWTLDGPDPVRLDQALRIAAQLHLCAIEDATRDPRRTYGSLQRVLSEAACYNPHRVLCPQHGTAQ